jgi:hypothetical protein
LQVPHRYHVNGKTHVRGSPIPHDNLISMKVATELLMELFLRTADPVSAAVAYAEERRQLR